MIDFKMTKELVMSLVFFVLAILFGFWSLIALTPLVFIIVFNLYKKKETELTITLLDITFAFLALGELITSLCSTYSENGSNTSFSIYIILFLYIAYRSNFKSSQKRILFSIVLFFLTVILTLITVISFRFHYFGLLEEGFTELNNFKNLYNPLGVWNNLWSCILLLLLIFTLLFLLNQNKKIFKALGLFVVLLLVFGIVVSFSRGIYLSIVCFLLSFNVLAIVFKQLNVKKLMVINFTAIIMGFLTIFIVSDSVLTTLAFNKTTSQQRSTKGRVDRWTHALDLISDNPITGWGNDNFILARGKKPYLSEDAVFSSKIDNTYLQILIEKGILGFTTYVLLIISCFIIIYRALKNNKNTRKQKLELTIVFSGLVAFLFRELTFSSFFTNNTVLFLAFHLVFFLIPYDLEYYKINISKKIKNTTLITFLLFIPFLLFTQIEDTIQNNQNNQFIKAFRKNERQKAFEFLEKASKSSPDNIILNKHHALLLSKNALKIDISNKHSNLLKFKYIDKDTLTMSKKYLKKVLVLNPYDDETYHNLGWIYFALNKKDSSQFYLEKALEIKPYNSTYRISKILYDIKNSNHKNIANELSKVIRYAPEVTESAFYKVFSIKYPEMVLLAEKEAVFGLRSVLETKDNPILKARLARLLLRKNPDESHKLLDDVTASLPNLSRPWIYKAFLHEKLGDTATAKTYYNKGIFLNKGGFLPKLYYANFLKRMGNDKKSIAFYKKSLQAYAYIMSETYQKNRELTNLKTIQNSYIPNDLLYYVKPEIHYNDIFNYFINHYKNSNNLKLQEFYENLSKKYESELYRGDQSLR